MSEPKHYVVGRLQEALAHDPRVGELDVHIKVVGDKVFLTGCVPTRERCEAITEVARQVLPDLEIDNQVEVPEYPEPQEPERLS